MLVMVAEDGGIPTIQIRIPIRRRIQMKRSLSLTPMYPHHTTPPPQQFRLLSSGIYPRLYVVS